MEDVKLKLLFLGILFKIKEENMILKKSKKGLANAANTYQWQLINGLESILNRTIDIVTVLPVGTYPRHYSDLILKTKMWEKVNGMNILEVGSINLLFVKQVTRYFLTNKVVVRWINENKQNNQLNILIYSTYLPYLLVTYFIDRKVKVILVVTDLPEHYDYSPVTKFRQMLRLFNNKMIYKLLKRIDGFVILTEQMKDKLSIGHRPYVVIEGLVSAEQGTEVQCNRSIDDKKVILYSGSINNTFGINNLLDAFMSISKNNYELWICGDGEAKQSVIEKSKIDSRIKFMGYVLKKEIYKLQQQATLLVNPRTNEGEYTKYSFPSKTMEYMLSGKPVLMYKLDGVPDEYDKYLYYLRNNELNNMADKIIEICEKPKKELDEFGLKAKQFVLENKNAKVQAQKITDMLSNM